jgi:hypothetical protein
LNEEEDSFKGKEIVVEFFLFFIILIFRTVQKGRGGSSRDGHWTLLVSGALRGWKDELWG